MPGEGALGRCAQVEKKFGQYLPRRVDGSAIQVDTAAVNAITPEELR